MSEVTINMDGKTPGAQYRCLMREISRRRFVYGGRPCEELVLREDLLPVGEDTVSSSTTKIVWCLAPMEKMVINGVTNPLVHHDYPSDKPHLADVSRRKCCEAFDEHHKVHLNCEEMQAICVSLGSSPDWTWYPEHCREYHNP